MMNLRFGTAATAACLMVVAAAGACANGVSGSLAEEDSGVAAADDSGGSTSSSSSGSQGSSSSGSSGGSSGSVEGSSSTGSSSSGSANGSGSSSGGGSTSSGSASGGSTSGSSSGSSASGSSGGSSSGGGSSSSSGGSSSSSSGSSSGGGSSSSGGCPTCGTTGKACTSDSQCGGIQGLVGNVCSTDAPFSGGELFPSAVCVGQSACDPCGGTTPCDNNVHFCDGPDAPGSPGVCLPTTNPPQTNMGSCLPVCTFSANGTAPTGCVGKDVCNVLAYTVSSPPAGIGYCLGGCTANSDCPGTGANKESCDTTQGLCLTKVTAPTKTVGKACTTADLGSTTTPAACNCLLGTSGKGFCSTFCTVGGSECPTGWFCETEEPIMVSGTNDASVPGFSTPNQGLAGLCVPSCGEDAGACPTNSTCTTIYAGGPGCIPP